MSGQAIVVDPDFPKSGETYRPDYLESETTSLASSIYRGVMENGRRYQTTKEGEYWGPSDEQQFTSLEAGHLLCIILDSTSPNFLFQAPVKNPKHILDLGTGRGNWAIDVADMYPDATVRGVDLFPPPPQWLPPNCHMEVDDVQNEWTWREPFDLIHLRQMIASWTPSEWDTIYKKCYDNIAPGGWIEQLEGNPRVCSDDKSLPSNSSINKLIQALFAASENWNHRLDTLDTMRSSIEKAGFVDIHEKTYKWPIGPWPKDPMLKEAGRLHYSQWIAGVEGWVMYFLTKWAEPVWSEGEVRVLLERVMGEIRNPGFHIYQDVRRVWARKPTEEEIKARV